MKTRRTIQGLGGLLNVWRGAGETIALVPTMGNLHDGHLALMRLAARRADRVVASVFVNPTQFGPGEDYHGYPRTPGRDQQLLARAAVDALFAPDVAEIYPDGVRNSTTISVPGLSGELCGRFRPGHFDGVASVVCRLLNIVGPDLAVFGEKDYQQLVVIRRMVTDLHLAVRIIGGPTMRHRDGLAMSSRNQYLTAAEREIAPELQRALLACRDQLLAGKRNHRTMEAQGMRRLHRAGFRPDYFEVRDAAALAKPGPGTRRLRVLAAAWLGRARLIDNVAVNLGPERAPRS